MATAGGLFVAEPAGDRPSFDRFKAAVAACHADPRERPDVPPAGSTQPMAYAGSSAPAWLVPRAVQRLSAASLVGLLSFLVGIALGGTLVHAKLTSWLRGEQASAGASLSAGDEWMGAVGAKASASTAVVAAYDGRILRAQAAAPTSTRMPRRPAAGAEGPEQFRIQVAEARSAAEVEAAWSGLVSESGDLLDGLHRYLLRATGAAGALYLVQVGPFPDLQRALAKCADLKRHDAECLVVRPS